MTSLHARSKFLAGLGLAACLGLPALAAGNGPYVGGSLGKPDWRADSVNGVTGDSSGTGGKLYGGWQFSPNFALEAGWADLGKLSGAAGSAKARGGFIDAVGTVPISGDWSALGRLGVGSMKTSTPGASERGNTLKVGLGAQYAISPRMALRGEWERYRLDAFGDKPKVDMWSVGLNYAF